MQENLAPIILNSVLIFFSSFCFYPYKTSQGDSQTYVWALICVCVCVCVSTSLAFKDPTAVTYSSCWQPVIYVSLQASVLKLPSLSPPLITSQIGQVTHNIQCIKNFLNTLPQEGIGLAAFKKKGSLYTPVLQPCERVQVNVYRRVDLMAMLK